VSPCAICGETCRNRYNYEYSFNLGLVIPIALLPGASHFGTVASSHHEQPDSAPGVARVQWASIKLLALDVDGVLTDGGLTFDENGSLLQTFNVRDGFALVAARRAGLKIAWISGRASRVAEHRFKELDLHHCILACDDKAVAMRELQHQYGFWPEHCCFVGDDLPDLPGFAQCGIRVAVADACDRSSATRRLRDASRWRSRRSARSH
jgi:3-deoxy-D-manno-octulosonate 8-phosphate phosphatase (KDO 8-P phosphatase)